MIQLLLLLSLFASVIFADTECPTVTSHGDRRSDKSKLRIAQYNVEWLFIDYYSEMNCPGEGCTWKNVTEAQTHMDYALSAPVVLHDHSVIFLEQLIMPFQTTDLFPGPRP